MRRKFGEGGTSECPEFIRTEASGVITEIYGEYPHHLQRGTLNPQQVFSRGLRWNAHVEFRSVLQLKRISVGRRAGGRDRHIMLSYLHICK